MGEPYKRVCEGCSNIVEPGLDVCPKCSCRLSHRSGAYSEPAPAPEPEGDEVNPSSLAYARKRAHQGAFLARFQECGRIDESARYAGVTKQAHYKWLREDQMYKQLYAEAMPVVRGNLQDEIMRRAVEGWEEPVYHNGEVVGSIRRFSDRLLERSAEAFIPEYRRRIEHSTAEDSPLEVHVSAAELLARKIAELATTPETPSSTEEPQRD